MPTSFNPNANSRLFALAISGNELYAGGEFTTIGGVNRTAVAKLNATSGNAFAGFNANPSGSLNGQTQVEALAVSGAAIFAGGDFTNIGGQARPHLARLSATTGNASVPFNANANNNVEAFAVSPSALYVGGSSRTSAGRSAARSRS